jgi:Tol biopolymer transport system component
MPSTRNLALVSFRGTQQLAVRDITVIVDPVTVSRLDRVGNFAQFVSANDLSAADEKTIVRMPLSGSPRNVVACASAFAVAWNPDGTAAAYITQTDSSGGSELHLVTGGSNRVLSSLSGNVITGCESAACTEKVFVRLSFSPSGNYISYVQTWGGPVFRLWASDGRLIKSIDSPQAMSATTPSMAVWSGNALYWRDAKGVEMWRLDNETLVLPDVAWIAPSASPGGKQIVYTARDAGLPTVYILDTASGQSRVLVKSRSGATFLNSHLIWYREERGCVAGDVYPCGDRPTIPSGKTYIYDLDDKTETESIIAAVYDVWPHAA